MIDNSIGNKGGALDGLLVVDLSRVLGGPYCTQNLADHGATVLKIEPPPGDETRGWGPPFAGEDAAYFVGVNRNKKGLTLNLTTANDRERLLGLLEKADVLVENFKPGTLEKWGLGYETVLSKKFPRLVHCAITGFGPDGPLGGLPGYDAVIQAMAGLMSVNGEAGGPPMRIGLPIVDMVAGLNAFAAILLALNERQRSGLGQHVDITLYDCGISLLHPHLANYFASGQVPMRTGNAHPNISPYDIYETKTNPIFLALGNDRQFATLCAQLNAEEVPQDPRFASNRDRMKHNVELKQELEAKLAVFNCAELANDLIRRGVPCGQVLDVAAAANHPHTRHRGMIVEIGEYKGVGSPIKMSRSTVTYRSAPPALGASNREIFPDRESE